MGGVLGAVNSNICPSKRLAFPTPPNIKIKSRQKYMANYTKDNPKYTYLYKKNKQGQHLEKYAKSV